MISFASDNCAPVAPQIMRALQQINVNACPSYGQDTCTKNLNARFHQIFGRPVSVFPTLTGTAANSLALATLCAPFGAVLCHQNAHIVTDECAAPEFFSGGARLVEIAGPHGKIDPKALQAYLQNYQDHPTIHRAKPMVLSLTQPTEAGTLYSLKELKVLTDIAHNYHLKIHMDGARFASALVALKCTPAQLTWQLGIHALSFGGTKGGCMAAEAVIFFDASDNQAFEYRRKKSGHLLSKMRFISAQLEAYLTHDLWLKLAIHANDQAKKLEVIFHKYPQIQVLNPVMANALFARLPQPWIESLRTHFDFYIWHDDSCRFMTSFDTQDTDIAALDQALNVLALNEPISYF